MTDRPDDLDLTLTEAQQLLEKGEPVELVSAPRPAIFTFEPRSFDFEMSAADATNWFRLVAEDPRDADQSTALTKQAS